MRPKKLERAPTPSPRAAHRVRITVNERRRPIIASAARSGSFARYYLVATENIEDSGEERISADYLVEAFNDAINLLLGGARQTPSDALH